MFREAIGRVSAWFFLGGLKKQRGTQMPIPDSYSQPSPTPVTFDSAMQLSAVWACTRLLSETVAGLPVMFTRRNGSEETPLDNDVSRLFEGKINRYQTRFEFMETLMLNLVMHGNFFALKERNGAGDLIALQPLMASQVEVRLMDDGSVAYYYYFDSGVQVYSEDSIWHVKLFGNGIIGMSPLGYARNTIGIAQAGEARVANIFKNGGKPSGVLMIDKVLKPEQRDAIRREFNELREGNSDRLMVLEADMKYSQISMTPQDIELLQSRRFQIEDLCRFMGVPSVLVNDTQGSTVWGSGIQQLVQGFYKLNLRPYLERIEASIIFNLMRPEDRPGAVVEFDFDAILRADMAARMDGWQKGINAGVFTPNEARLKEHLEPLEGGDTLYINGNMKKLSDITGETNGIQTPST